MKWWRPLARQNATFRILSRFTAAWKERPRLLIAVASRMSYGESPEEASSEDVTARCTETDEVEDAMLPPE